MNPGTSLGSRPYQPSTARQRPRRRPATRPSSRPRTGRAPASRPSASATGTGNPWSHGSAASPSNDRKPRSSPTAFPARALTPARRSSPGSCGTRANCASTAARCRCTMSPGSPASHAPATASRPGPGSWQKDGARPWWSARPVMTRSTPNGHQPQPRRKSPESRMPGKLARPVRRGAVRKRTRELRKPRRTAYPTDAMAW